MTDIFVRKHKKLLNVGDGVLNPDIDRFVVQGEPGSGEFHPVIHESLSDREKYKQGWEKIFGKSCRDRTVGITPVEKEVDNA